LDKEVGRVVMIGFSESMWRVWTYRKSWRK